MYSCHHVLVTERFSVPLWPIYWTIINIVFLCECWLTEEELQSVQSIIVYRFSVIKVSPFVVTGDLFLSLDIYLLCSLLRIIFQSTNQQDYQCWITKVDYHYLLAGIISAVDYISCGLSLSLCVPERIVFILPIFI